ncbi:MAG: putative lipid II flippase FtsW [Hydrogenophilales bacterium CG03_land_8_20_14_0_80_62_28]|nr:putative lipid II flippase FtsW [Betaproteobacteria bacterium]OIO77338.1 MAG: putative lipid II flippase FtsW [Hydrogenophilaceae bacterium CG1_02_62_390]PIV21891.1 MAG: putative lipid II flippase FtsW [Hydrogenophilales bacterium CG03_land_8_20_14_0_80_62_28]PIW38953.1 MAG: putative lipid II flippase FtsW [Hydrogenophilales bacterium CG15_BIG_FIL_POST_REV_8_21_14_020_62_31]PIW72975.1 MAG: putative lipid II flippase FtsW [Hydrogenophilales bacterium CG12_big_fil_rev_8_21_14_0_65_61_21]PIX02
MFNNAAVRRTSLAPVDWSLLWTVFALLGLGLVMVYSASIAIAEAKSAYHQSTYYLMRHAAYLVVGLAAAYGAFQLPSSLWQKMAPYLFFGLALCLIAVLIPELGRAVYGSRRWIPLGPLGNFQPSELVKLFTVIYAADYAVRKAALMQNLRHGFMPMFMVMLVVGWLLLMEPDFGAFVVIVAIALAVLFLGGLNGRLFGGLIVMLAIGFVLLIWLSPYRLQRVIGFMDPWADPYGKGYQLTHALIALGRGEWFGVGLGESVEKLFYLPEAYTDFLLAVTGEELGFMGVTAIIGLFAWLVWRAFAIGWQSALMGRNFQALTAQGIAVWLAMQSLINMGVNLGLLPTKGLTLPLMSYGGSGIVANCLAIALLVRIDFENRCLMKGKRQ